MKENKTKNNLKIIKKNKKMNVRKTKEIKKQLKNKYKLII